MTAAVRPGAHRGDDAAGRPVGAHRQRRKGSTEGEPGEFPLLLAPEQGDGDRPGPEFGPQSFGEGDRGELRRRVGQQVGDADLAAERGDVDYPAGQSWPRSGVAGPYAACP